MITASVASVSFAQAQTGTKKIGLAQVNTNVTVASIGENYIKAIGGKAAVDKITSYGFEADAEAQGMPLHLKMVRKNNGAMGMDVSVSGQPFQRIAWDGTDGYVSMQGQKTPIPADAKAELGKVKDLFPELNFGSNTSLVMDGKETINGEESYKLKGNNIIYYYSVKTGLKTGETKTQSMGGQEMTIPTTYADYKDVSGVKFPFTFSQSLMGQDIKYTITGYTINSAKDEDFK